MADTEIITADEELTKFVGWVESAEEATADARQKSERDRDYYDNIQLTAKELETLEKRGQPPIIINRVKRKIDFLEGTERQQRTDPKAYPRNRNDEEAARAATDGIRYVIDKERYDVTRSDVWKNLMVEGMGGILAHAEPVNGKPEIKLTYYPWDRLGADPASSKADFSDAKYKYAITWMDLDDAKDKFPGKESILQDTINSVGDADTYDDKPKWHLWADAKRNRVRIVEMYSQKGGDWHWCFFTKSGKLDGGKSPYIDEDKKTICPLHMTSAYVDRDNNRYGVVREMISPQDEINKRRSKALHLLTVTQVFAEEGAVADEVKAKQEMAKPDGWININPGFLDKLKVERGLDLSQGHFQLMQEAKGEIDLMGPNASMTGKGANTQSGRAIIAQQQGGLVEMGPLLDRLRQFNHTVYRAVWNLIRQFWTEERWVRVTDDERNLRFVGFNRKVTRGEKMMRDLEKQGKTGEEAQQIIIQTLQQNGISPEILKEVIAIENNPSEIDVDILIEEGPDSVTIQIEQFEILAQLAAARPDAIPTDVIIEAAPNLRNKEAILERIRGNEDAQRKQAELQQQQQAIQQQAMQLEFAAKQAKTERDQAASAKDVASIEKTHSGVALDMAEVAKKKVETAVLAHTPIPQQGL